MVKIKIEVPLFLIVFDLLFQMQEKSRRSISKKASERAGHIQLETVVPRF